MTCPRGRYTVRDAVRRSRRVSRRSCGAPNRARAQGVRPPRSAHPIAPGCCHQAADFRPYLAGHGGHGQRPHARCRAAAQGARRRCPGRAVRRDRPTRGYRWLPEPDPVPRADSPHDDERFRGRGARTLGFAGVAIAPLRPSRVRRVASRGRGPFSAGCADPDVVTAAHRVARPRLLSDAVSGRAARRVCVERGRRVRDPVRAMSGGAAERPVTADRQQNVEPAWSPGGELIAYHSRRSEASGSFRRWAARRGSQRVRVAPCVVARRPASGVPVRSLYRRLAIRLQREHPVRNLGRRSRWQPPPRVDGNRPADRSAWFAVLVSGRPPHRVRRVRRGRAWALDGGGRWRRSVRVSRTGDVFDPVFSPDGRTIYAAAGGKSILAIPVSPETGVATARPERIMAAGAGSVRHLSISRDGLHLAMRVSASVATSGRFRWPATTRPARRRP